MTQTEWGFVSLFIAGLLYAAYKTARFYSNKRKPAELTPEDKKRIDEKRYR